MVNPPSTPPAPFETNHPTIEQRYPKLVEALPTGLALTIDTINYIYTNVPENQTKTALANVLLGFLGDALALIEQDLPQFRSDSPSE